MYDILSSHSSGHIVEMEIQQHTDTVIISLPKATLTLRCNSFKEKLIVSLFVYLIESNLLELLFREHDLIYNYYN